MDPELQRWTFGLLVDPLNAIREADIVVLPSSSTMDRIRARIDVRETVHRARSSRWIDMLWSGARRGQVVRVECVCSRDSFSVDIVEGSFVRNPTAEHDVFAFEPPPGAIDVTAETERGLPTPERERALEEAEAVLDRLEAPP